MSQDRVQGTPRQGLHREVQNFGLNTTVTVSKHVEIIQFLSDGNLAKESRGSLCFRTHCLDGDFLRLVERVVGNKTVPASPSPICRVVV